MKTVSYGPTKATKQNAETTKEDTISRVPCILLVPSCSDALYLCHSFLKKLQKSSFSNGFRWVDLNWKVVLFTELEITVLWRVWLVFPATPDHLQSPFFSIDLTSLCEICNCYSEVFKYDCISWWLFLLIAALAKLWLVCCKGLAYFEAG